MGLSDRGYSRDHGQPFMAEWTAVMTIMVASVAVWVLNLVAAGEFRVDQFLSLRADLLQHPLEIWQLVTYGFVHPALDPWRLIGNMLMLWFFGREVEEIMGRGEFFRFYFTAMVVAGLAWLAGMQLMPGGGAAAMLMGATGAVMAVFAVFIWFYPQQTVLFLFVLPVPAWALGLLYLVLELQDATHGADALAPLAGGIFGLCYAWQGWNLSRLGDLRGWSKSWSAGSRSRRMRVVRPDDDDEDAGGPRRRPPTDDESLQDAVDRILEKISRSGEASLTQAERDTLTQASRKLKERMR